MLDPLFSLTLALSLAALFGAAAIHQVYAWSEWPSIVANYRLLPRALVPVAAIALPAAEFASALALLPPLTRPFGAAAAIALLIVFAVAIAVNLLRGRTKIDCGCFGSRLSQGIAGWMVGRNLALALLASLLLLPVAERPLGAFDALAAIAFALTAALLYPVLAIVARGRGRGAPGIAAGDHR